MSRRTLQVGELLREELTDIIRREVKDPRLGFWSITRVEVPPDLRSARVFISVLGSDEERTGTLKALASASGFIRHHLKPRLRMRQIPDLEFRDDRSMEHAEEIGRVLRGLSLDQDKNLAAPRPTAKPTATTEEER
ncbi:MAG: 30S ribosome-binding factor RbfA [Chloroflexia bacterium]|nr:30S ribosome-binding factor RbfA [Chloroflexia bacterium]